ncbi:hypothetical protein FQA39_LY19195 [Lamprigera yunnana]|nr:hypothetical protein FQA39_LY19195 [Lamprigera yunnana]
MTGTPAASPSANDTDLQLVQRTVAGDQKAYGLLVMKYQRRIERLIGRMVRDVDLVPDLAQETFLRAYRALPQFRGEARFTPGFSSNCVNTAKKAMMELKRNPVMTESALRGKDEDDETSASGRELTTEETPETVLAAQEIAQAVNVAMDALPEDLRQAIVLREIEGAAGWLTVLMAGDLPSPALRGVWMCRPRALTCGSSKAWAIVVDGPQGTALSSSSAIMGGGLLVFISGRIKSSRAWRWVMRSEFLMKRGSLAQAFVAGGGAKAGELAVVADGQQHVAVLADEVLVGRDTRVDVACALRYVACVEVAHGLVGQHGHAYVEQGHVDVLAFAAAVARIQRGQDGAAREDAGEHISHRYAHFQRAAARFTVGVAGDAHQAAHGLHHQVVARTRRVGAGLAEAGDGAVDEARVDFLQAVVIQAIGFEPADLEVLDQDVGLFGHLDDQRLAFGRCHVDGDAALVAVARCYKAANLADRAALRHLFGPDHEHIGDGAVGDPHLAALELVAAIDLVGAGGHAAGVGAVVGLGQAEAADELAAGHCRVLSALPLGCQKFVDGPPFTATTAPTPSSGSPNRRTRSRAPPGRSSRSSGPRRRIRWGWWGPAGPARPSRGRCSRPPTLCGTSLARAAPACHGSKRAPRRGSCARLRSVARPDAADLPR